MGRGRSVLPESKPILAVPTKPRLANGNTLLVTCHAGLDKPQTIAVPPEKHVVWIFGDVDVLRNSLPVAVLLAEWILGL